MDPLFTISLIFIALFVGIYIGKTIFNAYANAEKKVLEEKNNNLRNELENFKQLSDQKTENLQKQIDQLNSEKNELISQRETFIEKLSKRETEYQNLKLKQEEQQEEVAQLQTKFTKEFENLANRIFEEKSTKFTQQNKENIGNLLNPLQEKMQLFEKKVEESKLKSVEIHTSLKEQLKHLQEQNIKITQEAENLTKALKSDTKTQGNWGELILERVLEKSGLRKNEDYLVQQTFEDPNDQTKKVRPDVIVYLPNKKEIIIDSKVSLTHYERFINEEDAKLKEQYIKEHISSIKKHIDELSAKRYQEIKKVKTLDFVLLFIPNDPAFAYALNYDPTLWEKAFEKNIIIVTPITILSTLKTIDSLWNIEKRQKNVEEIARLAGTLFDKFLGFYDNFKKIGHSINETQKQYFEAEKKLITGDGNAVRTIDKLKKLGAKTSKSIPEELLKKENEINEIEIVYDDDSIALV